MVTVVARTRVCVDCICVDVEVEEEKEGAGAGGRSLPSEEPPVTAFATGVSGVDVLAGLPRIAEVRWVLSTTNRDILIFPATIGKPTTAGRDKQLSMRKATGNPEKAQNMVGINTATANRHSHSHCFA